MQRLSACGSGHLKGAQIASRCSGGHLYRCRRILFHQLPLPLETLSRSSRSAAHLDALHVKACAKCCKEARSGCFWGGQSLKLQVKPEAGGGRGGRGRGGTRAAANGGMQRRYNCRCGSKAHPNCKRKRCRGRRMAASFCDTPLECMGWMNL